MLHAILVFAQEEAEEPNKTPFYVCGILLVVTTMAMAVVTA